MTIRLLFVGLTLLLSFNVNANLVKETESFLKEAANGEAFWLYQPKEYYMSGDAVNKDKAFCSMIKDDSANILSMGEKIGFSDEYIVVFRGNSFSKDEKNRDSLLPDVHAFKGVPLPEKTYEKIASRLGSVEKEFFLVNPKKRQIINFKTTHPCLLENDLSTMISEFLKSEYFR